MKRCWGALRLVILVRDRRCPRTKAEGKRTQSTTAFPRGVAWPRSVWKLSIVSPKFLPFTIYRCHYIGDWLRYQIFVALRRAHIKPFSSTLRFFSLVLPISVRVDRNRRCNLESYVGSGPMGKDRWVNKQFLKLFPKSLLTPFGHRTSASGRLPNFVCRDFQKKRRVQLEEFPGRSEMPELTRQVPTLVQRTHKEFLLALRAFLKLVCVLARS